MAYRLYSKPVRLFVRWLIHGSPLLQMGLWRRAKTPILAQKNLFILSVKLVLGDHRLACFGICRGEMEGHNEKPDSIAVVRGRIHRNLRKG